MLGDKIVVKRHHVKAGTEVYKKVRDRIFESPSKRLAVSIAGESGSGKSEIADVLSQQLLECNNYKSIILHQDDYFFLPPASNDKARREDVSRVGMGEVNIDLMDEHIKTAKESVPVPFTTFNVSESRKLNGLIKKPLIDYESNEIKEETIGISDIKVVIVEGTYTTALKNIDIRVFIDVDYMDTLEHRKERARDKFDEFINEVLKIEHGIISLHKNEADIIIGKDYNVKSTKE
jgi:uridine kinase